MSKIIATVVVLGAAALGVGAHAAQMTYGTYLKATHNIVKDAVKPYLDEVTKKTDGALTFKYLTDGTVVSATTTAKGVQQGLVDMGMVIPLYSASSLPMTALFSALPQFKTDSLIATGVINELFFLNCEECKPEWAAMKILPMALYASSPYYLQCAKELNSMDDLKGKRIQGMGGETSAFLSALGALPVTLTISELYTGMSQGTLDCFLGSISWLDTYGTKDVVKYVVDVPLGAFRPMSQMNMNTDKWKNLSKDAQKAFVDGLVKLVADSAYGYVQEHQIAYKGGVAAGIKFAPPFAGFEQVFDASGKAGEQRFLELAQKNGMKDAQRILDRYLELDRQWREIVANATSQADYEKALHDRIFSKIKWPEK